MINFSRVCDGYSPCDLEDPTKLTKQCETDQVCFFKEELYIVAQNMSIDYRWVLTYKVLLRKLAERAINTTSLVNTSSEPHFLVFFQCYPLSNKKRLF